MSRVAARIYLPFGENFTNETGGLSSSMSVFKHWPEVVSQIRLKLRREHFKKKHNNDINCYGCCTCQAISTWYKTLFFNHEFSLLLLTCCLRVTLQQLIPSRCAVLPSILPDYTVLIIFNVSLTTTPPGLKNAEVQYHKYNSWLSYFTGHYHMLKRYKLRTQSTSKKFTSMRPVYSSLYKV